MSAGPRAPGATGSETRRAGPAPRRAVVRRRRLLLIALAAIVLIAVIAAVLLRDSGPDPFVGVYWDPDTGRRVEIIHTDGQYRLLYGVAKRGYPAERFGDELQVRDPFSGYVLVKATDKGLVLVSGKRSTKLEPLPAGR